MLTKSKIFYDHSTKQAIGYQNPYYLKKAQQLEPKLYDGDVIPNTYTIEIPNSEETLMLAEESRSKMLSKQQDPMVLEKKRNTKPVDYVALNKLSQDFYKRFIPQTKLSAEQAFWSQNSVPPSDPSPSSITNKVEVPKELPKVSMVNTSLKRLKQHLAGFDKVVKERTTATAITEGTWGFEHTKSCFRDEIIPFIKALKDIFNKFDQDLIDELTKVQTIFIQMEQAVEPHYLESKTFEVKMNQVLNENDRLLEQVINKDVVNVVMNSSVNNVSMNMHECQKENSVSNQSAPYIDQYFELNELKAQSQEKDKVIMKLKERIQSLSGNVNADKIKMDIDDIKTLNIELDHREQGLVITALKNELRKLKGKTLDDNAVTTCSIDPIMLKIDMEPITPRLLNKRTAHSTYIKLTQEEAAVLRDLVKDVKANYPQDPALESAFRVRPSTSASGSQPSGNTKKSGFSDHEVVQIVLWYLDSSCSKNMIEDRSQLTNFFNKFLGTVKFGNDHVAKIMGYGDYQIGNVTISRVYYVEGLKHNLFSVKQFCDSNLEVAFRQHTCFIRNLEGLDLLTGSRGDNLYTLSLGDMMASSLIFLLLKATKTKSWLWHRRFSHLNFGTINHLARHGHVRGLPKLKFEKDHLCSAYAMGKSKKKPHKPKSKDTNQEKLYLLHMDLCGPMCVASINGKKYILVIVDDYSWFTWVKCLRSKDGTPDFIIKFLKMIQV
ncbi:retrovirus-related pol polyprotein from transposon TNT 1-94 [Tanacetum coccineum]